MQRTAFTYASFGIAAQGFYAMSALMPVHTTASLAKSMRDEQKSAKLINKIEEARTEKLLMEFNRQLPQ